MANHREKYLWLLWTCAASLLAYYYLTLAVTFAFFFTGLIIVSKCLIEDHLEEQEKIENQNERNH